MTDKGPALDDQGEALRTGDLVKCLYKILDDGRIVDCAFVYGAISRIDYDFGYYSYYVNFKFEGKELRTCFDSSDITFRDRPPKQTGAKSIIVKEMLQDKGEITWPEEWTEDFTP